MKAKLISFERVCKFCGKSIKHKPQNRQFCGYSCSNSWQHANGIRRAYVNDKTTQEWWQSRYGDDWKIHKISWQAAISKSNSGENNPMFGRRDQMHGLKKFVSGTIGKTVEQIYGEEKGRIIRELRSIQSRGELNPAFGKVYARGGRSVKGYYKNFFFRSLFEYSFIDIIEQKLFKIILSNNFEF